MPHGWYYYRCCFHYYCCCYPYGLGNLFLLSIKRFHHTFTHFTTTYHSPSLVLPHRAWRGYLARLKVRFLRESIKEEREEYKRRMREIPSGWKHGNVAREWASKVVQR